jgi:hypothetical protein
MNIKFRTIGLAAATLAVCAAATVLSCKKKTTDDPSEIPDATSTFWSDAYRQRQLKGKVKTAIENGSSSTDNYRLLEFDAKGNLLKDQSRNRNYPDFYYGRTFTYDAQNRMTKIVYGRDNYPEEEVAEFAYDGSHTAYIPANIYDMVDLRLQKGISSVKYRSGDDDPLNVRCTSVSGNRIVFEGSMGWLAEIFGNIGRIEVECAGNYPAHIKFLNMGTTLSEAKVTFGSDGVPTKVIYTMDDGKAVTTEYTTAAGFLLMTKQYASSDPDDYTGYQYNDKGYLANKRYSSGTEYRYTYEYDPQGNWTKSTEERKASGSTTWSPFDEITREYTYW